MGSSSNILIENNFCYNIAAQMLMAEGQTVGKSSDLTIRNNVFHTVGAIALNIHGFPNSKIYNNLFIGGKFVAIRLNKGSTGCQVYNNLVVGIDAVWVDASSREGTTADYNLTTIAASKEKNLFTGPHDIFSQTPIFLDPEKLAFHLKPGSPGEAAGLDIATKVEGSTDKEGQARPSGKPWSLGPYQSPTAR